jgi:hypothetical protein
VFAQRSAQLDLQRADLYYLDAVGRESFYGHVAQSRDRLFDDEDFACLYCRKNGRPCVPPSLLAVALLLQSHDKVSDQEAVERANFDVRWCVALGLDLGSEPFAKSTLQLFRAQLLLHEKAEAIFLASLEEAKRRGFLRGRKRTLAVDTTPIFGKGAVKDTYNLVATGIVMLARALAGAAGQSAATWAAEHDLSRYFASSFKGEAAIDWDDRSARQTLLCSLVGDAQRLLELARKARSGPETDPKQAQSISEAAALLCQLLAQDIEPDEQGNPTLREGVAKDRIPSATDPEMRHGRKSKSSCFDGHKAALATDTETGLIAGLEVLPGNAGDAQGVLALVTNAEKNLDCKVDKTIGDCAYGSGATRAEFEAAGRTLVAKVPGRPEGQLSKDEFEIDLKADCATCPGGHTVHGSKPRGREDQEARMFIFPVDVCAACPLRPQCVKGKAGRQVTLHPQEALLQEARTYAQTPQFREDVIARQTVEHRIARLKQLGIRQSRFLGRQKTKFQVLMAAAVANLSLVWNADEAAIAQTAASCCA